MCGWVLCVCVWVCVQIGGYSEMPELREIVISVNLMELKGPTNTHTHTHSQAHTYFLQTTLIRLGSMLCSRGTGEYKTIGFRKYPYLIVCVCPRVFTVTLSLFWLARPASLISSILIALVDQQILLLSFCSTSCSRCDASIWISIP